jgi:hypothetical protein
MTPEEYRQHYAQLAKRERRRIGGSFFKLDDGEHARIRLLPPFPSYMEEFFITLERHRAPRGQRWGVFTCPRTPLYSAQCPFCDMAEGLGLSDKLEIRRSYACNLIQLGDTLAESQVRVWEFSPTVMIDFCAKIAMHGHQLYLRKAGRPLVVMRIGAELDTKYSIDTEPDPLPLGKEWLAKRKDLKKLMGPPSIERIQEISSKAFGRAD